MTRPRTANNTKKFHSSRRVPRWQRFTRRVVLPLTVLGLLLCLSLAAYARLGGSPASAERPFHWSGGTIFIAGSSGDETYTHCDIRPSAGEERRLSVPSADGGLRAVPWFRSDAVVVCGRSVSVTSGWQSALYPAAFNQGIVFGLAAVAITAWWLGRGGARRLSIRNLEYGKNMAESSTRPKWILKPGPRLP